MKPRRAPAPPRPPRIELDPRTVYFVESDRDDTVLLALEARVGPNGIEWFDTVRDRGFVPRAIHRQGDKIRFETDRAKYELSPLTIEIYNQRVIGRVDGHPSFRTTEELQQYYRGRF